jgi:hypothetical protein
VAEALDNLVVGQVSERQIAGGSRPEDWAGRS